MLILKQFIHFGSLLAFALLPWLLWRLRRPGKSRLVAASASAALLIFIWARFIEPQWIRVQRTELSGVGLSAELALVSDIHLGVFKGRRFLERILADVDALPVDALLIAGDLTYEPQGQSQSLDALFAPLAHVRIPVYAVLGNHDQQRPGPDIDQALRAALRRHGVHIIEGEIVQPRPGWRLAGLGDNWAGKDDPRFLQQARSTLPTLVLAHNPDSALRLRPADARLLLAGHTHGGQIRIPWLYRKAIPSAYGFDRGEQFAQTPAGPIRVFTSVGVGEVGLPMRLFNPPTIDWLSLRP